MIRKVFFIPVFLILVSCNNDKVFMEYTPVQNGLWNIDQKISFTLTAPDTVNTYNAFLNIRNDDQYEFSNLFLIVNLKFPDGNTVVDTLEYEMAKPNGEWLGKGMTSVKESKLWYKENIQFPSSGDYKVTIEQAMRKNGVVDGVEALKGITDVGFEVEKSHK